MAYPVAMPQLTAQGHYRIGCLVGVAVLVGLYVGVQPAQGVVWKHPAGIIGSPPDKPLVVIGKGRLGGHRWDSVLFQRPDGLCNEVALGTESLAVCGSVWPPAVTSLSAKGQGGGEVSVLSVVADSRARSVRAQLSTGVRVLQLRRVPARAAHRAHVSRTLRVFAQVYRGAFCLVHYDVLDRRHRLLYSSLNHPCRARGRL
jgi:hypothetical protein